MHDLILKNVTAIDSEAGLSGAADLAVDRGLISQIGNLQGESARMTIDLEGAYLTGGLIDYHCHYNYAGTRIGLRPEITHLPQGATTVVDGGSTGVGNFEAFYGSIMRTSALRTRALLLLSSGGQIAHNYPENTDPALMDLDAILQCVRRHKGTIVGLKLRQSKSIVGSYGLEPLKRGLEIAKKVGLPLSVHIPDSPGEVEETLGLLRPGDIYCHAYHKKGKTILDEEGHVLPEVWEARQRGVLFESANGNTNFSFAVGRAAFAEGFFPDIVSTDSAIASATGQASMGFTDILTVLLNLGMPWEELIAAATRNPARLCRMDTAFLEPGLPADLAAFKIIPAEETWTDFYGDTLQIRQKVICLLTVKDGRIVHRLPAGST